MVVLPVEHMRVVFEVKNNITLTVTVCIASFEAIGELQKRQSVPQHLAGMDEHVDNSCK